MGAAVAHPISPELVLVCPELRARALELLPAVDLDVLFAPAPRAVRNPVAVEPLAAAVQAEAPPRPRLVLVEEAPRPRVRLPLAFAAYAAEALLFGLLRGVALIAVIAATAFVLAR